MTEFSPAEIFLLRKIQLSRFVKELFLESDQLRRSGEVVLADLRHFCWADRGTLFSNDTHEMARREGRREVFVRLTNLLNLDEASVQKLMGVE